ncbi:trihelix transcription factor ASR3 isoform X1 [Syzygium oleosum]|uniref:trihelix transcription factor ASR3 isoform X1 n=1 Tax=Syzygium oleosum TaxID=219896 RepID=UPI0024B8DA30|nr:trihelix transcription factor ASR3 isoform X1 [Syzygium oleosum]
MAAEQLSLGPADAANGAECRAASAGDGGDDGGGGGGGGRAPRLPRWTRQEILVLIQGKRVAETRVRRGRVGGSAFGAGQLEPKWASVSSYCKRHGVNRGPVQCRKRWSNLAGDYKKIKEWEARTRDETESFWVMRNDLRRERKLPGFFDREVYDILDHQGSSSSAAAAAAVAEPPPEAELALALAPASAAAADDEEAEEERDVVFDSGRSAAAEDGLFSDFEQDDGGGGGGGETPEKEVETPVRMPDAAPAAAVPISEKQYEPVLLRGTLGPGAGHEKHPPPSNPEIGSTSADARKRKRPISEADEEPVGMQYRLIDVLERNGKLLTAQLEAQNNNLQLDRDQRQDHANGLLAVLNKLADAMGRIADKL